MQPPPPWGYTMPSGGFDRRLPQPGPYRGQQTQLGSHGELPRHRGPGRPYRKGVCGPLLLLCQVWGSVVPRVLPWAVLAAVYTALLHSSVTCNVWPAYCSNGHPSFEREDRPFLFVHTYGYQAVLLASGFGLVFRLNQSLARYWEARTASQNFASKWCDVILMALAFDEEVDAATAARKQCDAWGRCLLHLMSLLHAIALHTLRGDESLETLQPRGSQPQGRASPAGFNSHGASAAGPICLLGGLDPSERAVLQSSASRVHIVLGWLIRLIVRRRKSGGLAVDAPTTSRLHQFLSDGNMWYLSALKVCDTPFPFAYAQLNAIICFVNLALFPVIVADKVASLPLGAAVSFCAIFFIFGLNEVARDLEDPFTTTAGFPGTNRLHAPLMQAAFDDRLLAVAGSLASSCGGGGFGHFLKDALGNERTMPAAAGFS